MERYHRYGRTVIMDVCLFHLVDKLLSEGRASSDHLHQVVFEVGVLRLGDVEGYSFCSPHIEVGYNKEYSFHADKNKQKVLNFKQIMLLLH